VDECYSASKFDDVITQVGGRLKSLDRSRGKNAHFEEWRRR